MGINERSKMPYIISDADLAIHNLQLKNYDQITNEEKVSVISNSTSFESGFKKLINSSEVLHDRLIL